MSIFFNQDLFVGVVREHLVLDMAAIDPRYLMVVVKKHEVVFVPKDGFVKE